MNCVRRFGPSMSRSANRGPRWKVASAIGRRCLGLTLAPARAAARKSSPACTYRPQRSCAATRTERPASAVGIVIGRQRPDTASGVVFVTLEDETGSINVIVWRDLGDRQRRELLSSRLMGVYGVLERGKSFT